MEITIVDGSEAPASRDHVVYAVAILAALALCGATFASTSLPDPISAFEGFTPIRATATLAYLTGCLAYFLWYASVHAEPTQPRHEIGRERHVPQRGIQPG